MAVYYNNYGNTARALEPEPAAGQKQPSKGGKRDVVTYVYHNDHKHRLSLLTIITLMIIFAGAAGTAVSFAKVSVAKQEVSALQTSLREKQLVIANLTEEANRHADAISIMEAARGRLGMSEPKPYQIIHIYVPDENYVEYN